MRLAFQVAYIGTDFYGSQMQPGLRTVEGTVIGACRDLGLFDDWRKAGFAFSGRTDRGVHARRQICAFTTPPCPERAIARLNHILPRDCECSGWAETDDSFHPRYNAQARTYRYYIYDDGSTDPHRMQEAASLLTGTHNFSHFSRLDGKILREPFCPHIFMLKTDFISMRSRHRDFSGIWCAASYRPSLPWAEMNSTLMT